MEIKMCAKCKKEYELDKFFFRNDTKKYRNVCKICMSEQNKKNYDKEKNSEYQKQYLKNNQKKIKEYKQKYYSENQDKLKEKSNEYYKNNLEKIKEYKQKNHSLILEKQRVYYNNRIKNDIVFKNKENVRRLIQLSFKRQGFNKTSKTYVILGCSYEEFKQYLESKFESWMTWDNYGLYNGTPNYGWDIDHIIPSSSAITEEELIKLNHFTNLQPLCSYTNRDVKINKVSI